MPMRSDFTQMPRQPRRRGARWIVATVGLLLLVVVIAVLVVLINSGGDELADNQKTSTVAVMTSYWR